MRYTYTYTTKQRRGMDVMSTPCNHHSSSTQATSIINPYKINPCLLPYEGRGLVREGVASAISIPTPTFPQKSSFLNGLILLGFLHIIIYHLTALAIANVVRQWAIPALREPNRLRHSAQNSEAASVESMVAKALRGWGLVSQGVCV